VPCAGCHLPARDVDGFAIETRIARNPRGRDFPPTAPRAPFGRHLLVGGNTLVPALLRDRALDDETRAVARAGELAASVATPAELDATLAAAREQLERRAARVAVEDLRRDGEALAFAVRVTNLAGHKLPTGHPSRRAWLCVRVRDAAGAVLFASGEVDARGALLGADGAPLASERAGGPIEPHRDVVRGADEVALYQAVLRDTDGAPTFLLMRGAGFARDDRLLPAGWSPAHPDAARTAPVGTGADADFAGGGDRVRFELALPGAAGPLAIEAELRYQVLSARWLAELRAYDLPEVRALDGADLRPVVLDRATVTMP
jgi:hypothetical protein